MSELSTTEEAPAQARHARTNPSTQRAIASVQAVVSPLLPADRGAAVLDAGCGSKRHLDFGPDAHVTGIDLSQAALGRNGTLDERIVGDIESHPLPAAAYDAVVSWYVFEHLAHPERAMAQLARAVRPGGLVILAIPNVRSPKALITKFTPFWVHVAFRRHILGGTHAGLPGHGPFSTTMRLSIAPAALLRQAGVLGLEVVHIERFEDEKQIRLRRMLRLTGGRWRAVHAAVRFLSGGRLDATQTELVVVLRRRARPSSGVVPSRPRVDVAGVAIDNLSRAQAVDAIVGLASSGDLHYVVTPNVDHVVRLQTDTSMRAAYAGATLRLADGAPVVALSRLLGTPLAERVAGADLIHPLCARAAVEGLRVYLLGGGPGSPDAAAARLVARYPGLSIVGIACPPRGFEKSRSATDAIVEDIRRSQPNILFVCLGSPKQEVWLLDHHHELPPMVAVCAGAGIDFISGAARRAPLVWQRAGFEWLYRLLHEPRRLAGRYLIRDAAFLGLALRALRDRPRPPAGSPTPTPLPRVVQLIPQRIASGSGGRARDVGEVRRDRPHPRARAVARRAERRTGL